MPSSIKDRHPLNKGDFYINNGDCLACGVPQTEAPDLIDHGKDGHCHFKKQPQTETELDQAISAMMVSCISAMRYGGIEENILKRLYEVGLAELCDNIPEGKYPILVRDRVSFNFEGLMDELANFLIGKFTSMGSHVVIEKLTNNTTDHFSFVKRWTGGHSGLSYDCTRKTNNGYILQIRPEKEKTINEMTGIGALLYDFLKADSRITNIKWFVRNMPADLYYDKPY